MAKQKTYKCAYQHCPFGGQVDKEEAVEYKHRHYHKKCFQDVVNKEKIREYYLENVNKTEILSKLNAVISNIIDTKGVDSEFLLFAIQYAHKENIPIHTPMGLHYLVNNYKIKEAWKKEQVKKVKEIDFNNVEVDSRPFDDFRKKYDNINFNDLIFKK
jgi:hypothetical protein